MVMSEMSPVTQAQIKLAQIAREYYEKYFTNRPQILALAKHLCKNDGHEPDDIVFGRVNQPLMVGAKKVPAFLQEGIQPQWMLYVDEAMAAIELFRDRPDIFLTPKTEVAA